MANTDTVVQQEEAKQEESWSGGVSPFRVSYGKIMMWYFLVSDAFTFAGFLIAYGALRFSMPTWPVPDYVFKSFPGGIHNWPLIFVTLMTFVLLFSSFTMVRAVQEGARENQSGVIKWLALTIIGGAAFLSCQAWEWNTLIGEEHMTVTTNPFGTHVESGVYLEGDGHGIEAGDVFEPGDSYLIHKHHGEWDPLQFRTADGEVRVQQFGPRAFGALFFFITGFHGFHVFTGLVILTIILINVASGIYARRKNNYEMVEKVGLYWHFVDLVWVFVFLVFYLL